MNVLTSNGKGVAFSKLYQTMTHFSYLLLRVHLFDICFIPFELNIY